jgi:hypothetical protein
MVFWIAVCVIAVSAIFFRHRTRVSRDRLLQSLVDKGQPIPPELLRPHASGSRSFFCSWRAGVILICLGIAIFLSQYFGSFYGGGPFEAFGRRGFGAVFPFMIGVAFVTIALVERRSPPTPPPER